MLPSKCRNGPSVTKFSPGLNGAHLGEIKIEKYIETVSPPTYGISRIIAAEMISETAATTVG